MEVMKLFGDSLNVRSILILLFNILFLLIIFCGDAIAATFQQDSGAQGVVSMEAENFTTNAPQGSHSWDPITEGLQALPNSGSKFDIGGISNSPQLDYAINFTKTGTHYVWVYMSGPTSNDDSIHVGLNGSSNATNDRVSNVGQSWTWTNTNMSSARVTFDVSSTGEHTMNVWMREDGTRVNKIVLTTDPNFIPTGDGPPESPQNGGPTNNPPTVTNLGTQTHTEGDSVSLQIQASDPDAGDTLTYSATGLPNGLTINSSTGLISGTVTTAATFNPIVTVNDSNGGTDDATFTWTIQASGGSNNPPTITNPGNQANTENDSVSLQIQASDPDAGDTLTYSATGLPNGLTINSSTGLISGTVTTVNTFNTMVTIDDSNGGTDNVSFTWTIQTQGSGSGVFQQDSGAQGVVSMEAENFTTNAPQGSHSWDPITEGLQALPNSGSKFDIGGISNSPQLDYAINFTKTGTHYVWVYMSGPTSNDDSIHVGLNGSSNATNDHVSNVGQSWTWTNTNMSSARVTFDVSSTGEHTMNVWMREDGTRVNKIVLTTDPNFIPTGDGPPESPQNGGPTNNPPTVTNLGTQTHTEGDSVSLQIQASDPDAGDTLTYSATGLPNGLTINSSTGLISGTVTTAATFNPIVTVNDSNGGTDDATFTWTIQASGGSNNPPTITNPGNQANTENDSVSLQIQASDPDAGDTLTYSATGLPNGLTINSSTGLISGTVTTVNTFNTMVTIDDSNGGTDNVSFTWTIQASGGSNNPPTITNPGNQANTENDSVSLQIQASDPDAGDTLTYSATGLPNGLTINSSTGLISGTVTTVNTFNTMVTIDDSNGGTDNVSFTWTIQTQGSGSGVFQQDSGAQGVVSMEAENFTTNAPQGSHSWDPITEGLQALPNSGSKFDIGGISNSPQLDYAINFTKTGTHYVWVYMSGPTSNDDSIHVGLNGSSNATNDRVSNVGQSWTWTNTNMSSARVTFDVSSTGEHTMNVWMREDGTRVNKIVLTTDPNFIPTGDGPPESPQNGGPTNNPPTVTNLGTQTHTEGDSVSLQIQASDPDAGDTLTYSATGLPNGLTINSSTGLISGTVTTEQTVTVNATVDDGNGGSDSTSFSWIVNPVQTNSDPVITSPGAQNNTVNDSVSLQINASDADGDTLTFSATSLPNGINISSSGLISGTVTTEQTVSTTVSVDDGNGGTDSVTFTWNISSPSQNTAPEITDPGDQTNQIHDVISLQLIATDADGDSLSYISTNLPFGLSLSSDGLISGTLLIEQTITVSVAANDGQTTSTYKSFIWTITDSGSSTPINPVLTPTTNNDETVSSLEGSFSVTPTGAATYSVPVIVSPGTAGMNPRLSLTYNSSRGNGLLGLGWMIQGMSQVHRCAATKAKDDFVEAVEFDANDRFCLDGQPLIAVDSNGDALANQDPDYGANLTEYRTEINQFSKIISYGQTGNGPAYFKVWTKAGEILEYGNSTSSFINPPKSDDTPTTEAICWLLNKRYDTLDNYIEYDYTKLTTGEHYPNEITYTKNDSQSLTGFAAVKFNYEDRSDTTVRYVGGRKLPLSKRLASIESIDQGSTFRTLNITYEQDTHTNASRIDNIDVCFANNNCIPSTNFTTVNGGEGTFNTFDGPDAGNVATAEDASRRQFVDINGDGRLDLYYANPNIDVSDTVYVQNEDGTYADAITNGLIASIAPNVHPELGGFSGINITHLANANDALYGDFNGDGRIDILDTNSTTYRYCQPFSYCGAQGSGPVNLVVHKLEVGLSNADGTVTLHAFPYTASDSVYWMYGAGGNVVTSRHRLHNRIRLGDFNADGLSDFIILNANAPNVSNPPKTYLSNGDGSFTEVTNVGFSIYEDGDTDDHSSGVARADGYVNDRARWHVGDFNGDGATDLYFVRGQGGNYADYIYFSDLDGTFSQHTSNLVTFKNGAERYTGLDISRYKSTDLNGDGLTDIYYINGSQSTVADSIYLSTGDGNFASPIQTHFSTYGAGDWTESNKDYQRFKFGDFNGDGVNDLYYIVGSGSTSTDRIYLGKGDGSFAPYVDGLATFVSSDISAGSADIGRVNAIDINADGLSDIYYLTSSVTDTTYINQAEKQLVTNIENGFGTEIDINYSTLHSTAYSSSDDETTYPDIRFNGAIYLVSETLSDTPSAVQNQLTYHYRDARFNLHGRGFLGFLYRTETDTDKKLSVVDKRSVTFPYIGQRDQSLTCHDETSIDYANFECIGGIKLSTTTNTMATIGGTVGPVFPYPTLSETTTHDLESGALMTTNSVDTIYDNYGNATNINVTISDVGIGTYTNQTTNTFTNDSTNWILGRLTNVVNSRTGGAENAPSRTSSFTYDATTGLLSSETIEPGNATYEVTKTYIHDAFGNRTTTMVSGASVTSRSYTDAWDTNGRYRLSHTNALGHVESYENDNPYGLVSKITGPNGFATQYVFDGLGRTIREVRSDGNESRLTYALCAGTCPSQINAHYKITRERIYMADETQGAPTTIEYYDALGNLLLKQGQNLQGQSVYVERSYDSYGRVLSISQPYTGASAAYETTYEYDEIDRIKQRNSSATGIENYTYDSFVGTVVNADVQVNKKQVDSLGRTLWTEDNAVNRITFEYDSFGNLLKTINSDNVETLQEYNIRGQVIKTIDPDRGTQEFTFNAFGELISQKNGRNQITSATYDALGRIATRTNQSGVSTYAYDYNVGSNKGIGLLRSITRGDYTKEFSYNEFLRPTLERLRQGVDEYYTATTYDKYGRTSSIYYPTGENIEHEYNTIGHLTKVKDSKRDNDLWEATQMDAFLNVTSEKIGHGTNQITRTSQYLGNSGRIDTIQSSVQDLDYDWDILGNLEVRTDNTHNVSETFEYDLVNRLSSATLSTGGTVTATYFANGNIATKSDVGAYHYSNTNAGPHAVTSISGVKNTTYTYDADGNMLTGDGRTITWTDFGKPISISQGGSSTSFIYDPEFSRLEQTINTSSGQETIFYVGALAEFITKSDGQHLHSHVFANGRRIATLKQKPNNVFEENYYHHDHIGSINLVTSATGQVLETLSYDAWGKRRLASWLPGSVTTDITRGFTDHEMLDSVGLVHMNGRLYDPEIGRFISADPFVQLTDNMQNYNRYSYVLNNPLSYTDSSGYILDFVGDIFGGLGDILGDLFDIDLVNAVIAIAFAVAGCPQCSYAAIADTAIYTYAALEQFESSQGSYSGGISPPQGSTALTRASVHDPIGNDIVRGNFNILAPFAGIADVISNLSLSGTQTANNGKYAAAGRVQAEDTGFIDFDALQHAIEYGLSGIGSPWATADHIFSIETAICRNCNPAHVYDAVLRNPAPLNVEGYRGPLHKPVTGVRGEKTSLWIGNVTHDVDAVNMVLINKTTNFHLLDLGLGNGQVLRRVVEKNGVVYIQTVGRGDGPFAFWNDFLGPRKFRDLDEQIRRVEFRNQL